MDVRTFVGESKSPAPTYREVVFDGLRFYECTFPAGSWQTYIYHQAVRYSDAPTCHIQVSGLMREAADAWPEHPPGWMSRADSFIIPAGSFTRVAVTDCVRWCCVGGPNGAAGVTTISLQAGEALNLVVGDSVLPVSGGFDTPGGEVLAGRRIRCSSAPTTVTAKAATLAFIWGPTAAPTKDGPQG